MKTTGKQLIYGVLLLLTSGAVLVLNIRAVPAGFIRLWPFLVLAAGLALALIALTGRRGRRMLLAAGTFLAFAAIFLFLLTATSWRNIIFLWPGFLLALGLALGACAVFGATGKAWRLPAAVLVVAALLAWVLYTVKSRYGTAVGAGVLLTACYFLIRGAGLGLAAAAREPRAEAVQPGGGEAGAAQADSAAGEAPTGGKAQKKTAE